MGEDNKLEIKVAEHTQQIKTINYRLDKIENISENLNKVSVNLDKLTMAVDSIVKVQEKQATDIETLKYQPGRTAKDLWMTIVKEALKAIVVALITALLVLVIKK